MNSTLKGLRPTVGLRRPKNTLRVGEGRRLARKRLRRPISIGGKASGRRSACAPNEFGLQGPSADGRPAPTEKYSSRRRRPTPGAQAPQKADFNRREGLRPTVGFTRRMNSTLRAFGRRSACADRKGIPCVGEGRRLARKRLKRPISIGAKADARRGVRRMNSASRGLRPTVGLRRPGDDFCVGEGRGLTRKRLRGRFQSAQRPSANGRLVCRMNSASRGLWPTVGLRRPERHSLRRRRPTPGAQAPRKADFNRREGRRPARGAPNEFGLQRPLADGRPAPTGKAFLASAKADAWRESA
jgi:hypothetical protein